MKKKFSFSLSSLALKIIAALLMTIDHIGLLFVPNAKETYTLYYILRAIGKIAFPIFAFLAVEGAYHTQNAKKYLLRLLLSAILLNGVGYLVGYLGKIRIADNPIVGNAFMDMFLGVLTITLLRKKNWYSLFALLPISYAVLSNVTVSGDFGTLFKTDWGTFSIALFLCYFLAKELSSYLVRKKNSTSSGFDYEVYHLKYDKLLEIVALFTVELAFYLLYRIDYTSPFIPVEFVPIGSYSCLAALFLLFYNGRKGYDKKWIQYSFYVYYPLHLLILGIFSLFFGVLSTMF